jgi:16S rRNA (adenine1518-N6/adenine1519-N6)-dimethyltransferase
MENQKKIKAKKSLGQNFLHKESILKQIVSLGEVTEDDTVLEVGPGLGALTEKILEKSKKVIAIEKDDDLIPVLNSKFADHIKNESLNIINGDVLNIDISKLNIKDYKIIANIPYYITGEIIRFFLENKIKPKTIVFLVQREVAKRITDKEKESILSLSVKLYGNPKYEETVSKRYFKPIPKVDSAILSIKDIKSKLKSKNDEILFFKIIKEAFKSKRKQTLNNLESIFNRRVLESFFEEKNIRKDIRSEDIKMEIWIEILNLYKRLN